MSSASDLLVHIGYHKTGTTWLQTGLFRDRSAGFVRPWTSGFIRDRFVLCNPFTFDHSAVREAFAPTLEEARSQGLTAVVSDERLSGSPHAGGFDSALVADRLAAAFPDARVLIVIREQRQAIYSVYQQYVRDGGAASLSSYLRPRNPAEIPQFRLEHYEYHHLVRHYQAAFGEDCVMVLPFERLRDDLQGFVGAICSHVGRPASELTAGEPYPSLSALGISLKRRANLFLVRNALNPQAPLYVKDHERRFAALDRHLPERWSRRIASRRRALVAEVVGDLYRESNRQTSRLTQLPLDALGYDV